jgi:hypothetical protein
LRLLAAANDDAVLAAWAAVFDEHKMSPECDVSPYDCWEVLQEFLSSGVLSPLEYNSVNLKAAFFNGTRPSTGQIQEVLGRLKFLRANQSFDKEFPVSNARPPMAAFTNESALVTREERGLPSAPQRNGIGGPRPNPGLAAFQPQREVMAPQSFRAMGEAPAIQAFAPQQEKAALPCRKVDANLYRGVGEFNIQMFCCNQEMIIQDLSEDEPYDGELEDGTEGVLHEFMFHTYCQSCGARFHTSMARRVPDQGY